MSDSYINAPATKLLAQHCCICHRPLLDADSVTAGMGPDCRKKYGDPQTNPNWDETAKLLINKFQHLSELANDLLHIATLRDQHKLANKLTHFIAAAGTTEQDQGNAIAVLYLAGYHKMAMILARRTFKLYVFPRDNDYLVHTKYDETFRSAAWKNRFQWDKQGKYYTVPNTKREQLWDALMRSFENHAGISTKGVFKVERK